MSINSVFFNSKLTWQTWKLGGIVNRSEKCRDKLQSMGNLILVFRHNTWWYFWWRNSLGELVPETMYNRGELIEPSIIASSIGSTDNKVRWVTEKSAV